MNKNLFKAAGIVTITLLLSACASKSTNQIGFNSYSSMSDERSEALYEANNTCKEINKEIKVIKERSLNDKVIIDYKCLNVTDHAVSKSSLV